MIEVHEDLWEIEANARCIPTNGIVKRSGHLVMGAGVANQALIKFPGIDKRLGEHVRLEGNYPVYLMDIGIISFPTKTHWRDRSSLHLIIRSAKCLKVMVNVYKLQRIAMPAIGCGLGGLTWDDVKSVIEPVFDDDRFVVCLRADI